MKTITIKYGVQSITRSVTSDTTVGDLRDDDNVRAILGFGDNTRWLIAGVEQPDNLLMGDGQTIVVETKTNTKNS